MIHQELMPIPDMTVAENLLLGREPVGRLPGWIDRRAMRAEAERLLALLHVDLPVDQPMRNLSVAKMQAVEIAKALGQEAQHRDHGRTDGRLFGPRGGIALRRDPRLETARRGDRLYHA